MADLPLIRDYRAGAALAYRDSRPIGVEQFLRDVRQLADLLPERRHVLNLLADRYRFLVGFGAALLRRQVSLLPPNQTPRLLERLSRQYPDMYCLTDAAGGQLALDTVPYPTTCDTASPIPPVPSVPAAQTAAVVFTSGTTGDPLPHQKSWGGLVRSARAEAQRLGLRGRSGMVILGTVLPRHMYGLESTVLMPAHNGLALYAGRPFYPADIRAELEALPRPRGLVTTPVHLRALLAESARLPLVDFLLCATTPLSLQLAEQAEARFATPLYEIYGCTEAGQVATRRTVETATWRALPGITLRQDERGTWVGGGHVETEVLLADVIELRDRGRFLLRGRTADLVDIAGKRTSLASLDYQLNSIEGVVDGAFVVPDQDGVQITRLMAFVVAPGVSNETIMSALRERIDAAFLPRPLCVVDTLPRNATGKLPREALHRLMAQRAVKAG
jgi:acyl-coenzyme A synthetase/AMP-(fatty) acid ligase